MKVEREVPMERGDVVVVKLQSSKRKACTSLHLEGGELLVPLLNFRHSNKFVVSRSLDYLIHVDTLIYICHGYLTPKCLP